MSGAVFTLGNSVSGSLGLGDALSKFGRVAVTGLTIEQDPDTVNSYLTTRYAGLSAVTSGGVTTFLNPSLVVIPSAYNNGIVYSLHSRRVNTGDFTVTRNTEARRVNSAGLIASVGSGLPRLDYLTSGGTAGTPALLVEPAATNLSFHSEVWAVGNNWQLTNITRTTGSTDAFRAPDGTFTANGMSPTSATLAHYFLGNPSPNQVAYTSGTIYTQSAFFKQGTGVAGRYVQLVPAGAAFTQFSYANFDLQLGTVTVVSGSFADANRTARIENYGNGWYRCSITATCNASGINSFGATPTLITASGDGRLPTFSGTTTDVLYGWGTQLEVGSVATSYMPTTTGTTSRSADVISVSGAVSGSIGQTEGTIYAEVDFSNSSAGAILLLDNGSTSTFLNIVRQTNQTIQVNIRNSGGSTTTLITSSALANGVHKIALSYASADYVLYIDGNSAGTSTSAATFPASLTRVSISNEGYGAPYFPRNDRIRAAALYTTRLTNQQLQLLTTP